MKWVKLAILAGLTVSLFWFLDNSHSISGAPLPPLGRFLNPFAGFWLNGERLELQPPAVSLPELQEPAKVVWDENRIPHIFAANQHDLFLLQGYITAGDRLWQMEFQTLATAGRLTEIVGEDALAMDRYMRRLGLQFGAERFIDELRQDPESSAIVKAYTAGVNAWIRSLDRRRLPLEYKILDYLPEPWTDMKCALLFKHMSLTLSGYNSEKIMSVTRDALGNDEMARLFPDYPPFMEPIVPEGTRFDFEHQAGRLPDTAIHSTDGIPGEHVESDGARGSNNWAVAGSRTLNGYPLLSNDPHLPLSLPSIWYEVHLNAPGLDTYGVSFPGAPTVIIGFNRSVAWGPTNAESDALDWYRVRFRNESRSEYMHGGEWKPVKWRTETYLIRDGGRIEERVPYTHHGPVPYGINEPPYERYIPHGAAVRWTAHDPSNEVQTFLKLNKANRYEDFIRALSSFDSPAQNFAFASVSGDIAIWHMGKFPLRRHGQGKYISDGTDPAFDWRGWVPKGRLPHLFNPECGFVSSANNSPAGPDYPYYLGSSYAPWERAARINELLSSGNRFTHTDMIEMQNDTVGLYARRLLPVLLQAIDRQALSEDERRILGLLDEWGHEYLADEIAPSVFDAWHRQLHGAIWADDMGSGKEALLRPRRDVTVTLLLNGDGDRYVDNSETEEIETLEDLVLSSFREAIERLTKRYGPVGERWKWGAARGTDILHLLQIPALGRNRLPTSGQYGVLKVSTRNHGQSWQMVVEMGPEVHGWGNYPGGQSGSPGSTHYDDFIDDWLTGTLREFIFPHSPDEDDPRLVRTTEFKP